VTVCLPGDVVHVAAQVAALRNLPLLEVLEANLSSVHQIYGVRPVVRVEKYKRSIEDEEVEVVKAKFVVVLEG
jgi:hypothetical protein